MAHKAADHTPPAKGGCCTEAKFVPDTAALMDTTSTALHALCYAASERRIAPETVGLLAFRVVLTESEWERSSMGRGSMVRLRRFAAKLLAGKPVTVGAP